MHVHSTEDEITTLEGDNLLCGALNCFLSLPSFPKCLHYDKKSKKFNEVPRYEPCHREKFYQPVFTCSISDVKNPKCLRRSFKSFGEVCRILQLECFHQSDIYISYIFTLSLNKILKGNLATWDAALSFLRQLNHCAGYREYLCWIALFKCSSKDTLKEIRLKYFRPNQISYLAHVPFSDQRGSLMESLVKNIASYWYPRVGYSTTHHDVDRIELRDISEDLLDKWPVGDVRRELLQVISYEELSGHVFRTYLISHDLSEPAKYLNLIKGCFTFYSGFTFETVDSLWAKRSAWKIISDYLTPGGQHYVEVPAHLLSEIRRSANPPYEDLLDGVMEFAIFNLIPCLQRYFTDYMIMFSEIPDEIVDIEIIEEAETEPDITEEKEISQDIAADVRIEVTSDEDASAKGRKKAGRRAKPGTPQGDSHIISILRNRSEFERFKAYLATLAPTDEAGTNAEQTTNPMTDLECYIDIEKFKIAKGKPPVRDDIAGNIKSTYLTKKYFFGPVSPAPRTAQISILGGSGHKMPARPPSPVIMQVQEHVLSRLNNKWIKQYRSTEEYQIRQTRSGSALGRRKSTDTTQSYVFVDAKARANAHDLLQLRKTLLDPDKSEPLKRYAKAKSDRLLRDIEFWVEVQKYKDMQHRHSSTSMIRRKIDTIIDCFLDSTVAPKVQVSVPNEVAQKVTDARYDLGPYLFRQAQSIISKVLCTLWNDFIAWFNRNSHRPLVRT